MNIKMNKNEYLDRLSRLLADISYEEHEEALSYYREYIEDAGSENEQRVIEELGTPEHLAQEIREGLASKGEPSKRQGEPINAPDVPPKDSTGNYGNASGNTRRNDADDHHSDHSNGYDAKPKAEKDQSKMILLILLLILTSPIWFSLACTIISVLFGCIVGIIAVAVCLGAGGIICITTGIALIVSGIAEFMSIAVLSVSAIVEGSALIGAGLIVLALGILFMILTVWLFGWALPALVRFIRQTISRISCRRKEAHV